LLLLKQYLCFWVLQFNFIPLQCKRAKLAVPSGDKLESSRKNDYEQVSCVERGHGKPRAHDEVLERVVKKRLIAISP